MPVHHLEEYARGLKENAAGQVQELLNNNTDGPGNPLSRVLTRKEAKSLFAQFPSMQTRVYWLVKKNIPFVGRYIPRPLDQALGRLVGWALQIRAVK